MKLPIKHPDPASRPFWAVSKHSESGISHLVKPEAISDEMPFLADYPANYASACGLRYSWYELLSAGSRGIGARQCNRCMSAKENNIE